MPTGSMNMNVSNILKVNDILIEQKNQVFYPSAKKTGQVVSNFDKFRQQSCRLRNDGIYRQKLI